MRNGIIRLNHDLDATFRIMMYCFIIILGYVQEVPFCICVRYRIEVPVHILEWSE